MSISRMTFTEDGYFINRSKSFIPRRSFRKLTIEKTFDFAYSMSFGEEGAHRKNRSGGTHERKNGEIFANTFQGKLSEFAIYNELYLTLDKPAELSKPTLDIWNLGKWDEQDFIYKNKTVSVKSTKSFGNLLLLETKDWNNEGLYIPNLETDKKTYDIVILVRINPYCEDILKKMNALYSTTKNKFELKTAVVDNVWEYDIPGFITNSELKYIIQNKYIIEKGKKLNQKTTMDATNYYIQSGDLRDITEIKKVFLE